VKDKQTPGRAPSAGTFVQVEGSSLQAPTCARHNSAALPSPPQTCEHLGNIQGTFSEYLVNIQAKVHLCKLRHALVIVLQHFLHPHKPVTIQQTNLKFTNQTANLPFETLIYQPNPKPFASNPKPNLKLPTKLQIHQTNLKFTNQTSKIEI
jgi:hypothetical protein